MSSHNEFKVDANLTANKCQRMDWGYSQFSGGFVILFRFMARHNAAVARCRSVNWTQDGENASGST